MRPAPQTLGVCALVLAAGLLGGTSPARAWTDARLTSADAHVEVWPSGQALVRLTLALEVRAGYLSSFEIAGLDPALVLDPDKPPSLLRADGTKARPQAELKPDGTLALSFPRASAPRRGRHQLELGYALQLAITELAGGRRRASVTLPAWRHDLEDVDLWISAPAGTVLARPAPGAPEFESARIPLASGSRTVLHLHRAQLPRAVSAGAELDLPPSAPPVPARSLASSAAALGRRSPLWLAFAVPLLVWLKRRALSATCARSGAEVQPLLRMRPGLLGWLIGLLSSAAAFLYPYVPPAGLGLLCLVVVLGLARPVAPKLGSTPAKPAPSATGALYSVSSWLDATALTGFSLLASAYVVALGAVWLATALGPGLELLIVCTPLLVTGTRLHLAAALDASRQVQPELDLLDGAPAEPTAVLLTRSAGAVRRAPDRAA